MLLVLIFVKMLNDVRSMEVMYVLFMFFGLRLIVDVIVNFVNVSLVINDIYL